MSDDVIDLKDFAERVQDDKDLMLELFDIFIADFQVKQKSLQEAVGKKNLEEVSSIAHSLKGASGNISAKSMRATCLKIEEMGKNSNLAGMETLLKDLNRQYQDLLKRINEIKKEFSQA